MAKIVYDIHNNYFTAQIESQLEPNQNQYLYKIMNNKTQFRISGL